MDEREGTPSQVPRQVSRDPCFGVGITNDFYQEVNTLPNIKSAKKRVIVTKTKTLQNKIFRTQLKTDIKKFEAAVAAGDKEAATAAYAVAVKKVDQAAARGILHKNAAAHRKSRFTKKLNAMA